jgi:hypothetical protein
MSQCRDILESKQKSLGKKIREVPYRLVSGSVGMLATLPFWASSNNGPLEGRR